MLVTRRAALMLVGALPGCTLIDQRTFDKNAGKPPVVPVPAAAPVPPPPEPGPPPLMTIRLPTTANLRGDIAQAVAAARARKPDVVFEVVQITSGAGEAVGEEAAEVARLIIADGVPPGRVHLAARPVPNVEGEVRVYVH
jgi:hypothetical protein